MELWILKNEVPKSLVLSKLRVKLSFEVIVAVVSFVNNNPFDAVILPNITTSPPKLWSPVPLALI